MPTGFSGYMDAWRFAFLAQDVPNVIAPQTESDRNFTLNDPVFPTFERNIREQENGHVEVIEFPSKLPPQRLTFNMDAIDEEIERCVGRPYRGVGASLADTVDGPQLTFYNAVSRSEDGFKRQVRRIYRGPLLSSTPTQEATYARSAVNMAVHYADYKYSNWVAPDVNAVEFDPDDIPFRYDKAAMSLIYNNVDIWRGYRLALGIA